MPPIGFLFGFPFSLVWAAPLGWVNGDGCGWSCVNQVTFVSNVTIRSFLSSGAMVLSLDPSMISFSSVCLTSPCSRNSFIQYRIRATKDDRGAIAWFSSYLFPSVPSV